MNTQTQTVKGDHVPDGWQRVRLGDAAKVVMGQSPPGETVLDWDEGAHLNSGLPFVQGNAEFGINFPDPLKWCTQPVKVAYPDDLLISVRAPVGETNRANQILGIGRGLAAIQFDEASRSYGWHAVNQAKESLDRVAQGSTFQAIGSNELRSLPILLPPLAEQQRIAAILDAIDEAIDCTEAVIAATERLRDALLDDLLTLGVPGWHSEWRDAPGLGVIPADWEVVRLGDVAEVKSGIGFPIDRQGRLDGAYPFIKVSDMTLEGNGTYILNANNYVDFKDVNELGAHVFTPGTIVFPKVGAAIATNKKRVLTVQTIIDNNMAGVTVADTNRCNRRFLYHWFKSIDLFKFANVSAVPSITGSRLKLAFVPLPPLSEQGAIAAMIDGIEEAIGQVHEERDGLQSLKASASDALLTGRVRVPLSSGIIRAIETIGA